MVGSKGENCKTKEKMNQFIIIQSSAFTALPFVIGQFLFTSPFVILFIHFLSLVLLLHLHVVLQFHIEARKQNQGTTGNTSLTPSVWKLINVNDCGEEEIYLVLFINFGHAAKHLLLHKFR